MKIFITGGHVTPAVAVIEEIQKKFPDWEIVFVGRKFALEGEKEVSAEYRLVTDMGIRFLPIYAGRYAWKTFLKIFIGFLQAFFYLVRERPAFIVSFGGYIAPPVVIIGTLFGIPSLTHEQTHTVGAANKVMIPFVKKICISYEKVMDEYHVPKEKTVVTGLPLREELFIPSSKPFFPLSSTYPLLYIAGGATGSESINTYIFSTLPQLLKKYTLLHQTGYTMYPIAQEKYATLPKEQRSHYHVFAYLNSQELAWVYHHAKLYIGRSGGNTIGELAALGKVAILIPLPWSAGKEQERNAEWLVSAGSAIILSQHDMISDHLLKKINDVLSNFETYHTHAQALAKIIPRDGALRVLTEIQHLLP